MYRYIPEHITVNKVEAIRRPGISYDTFKALLYLLFLRKLCHCGMSEFLRPFARRSYGKQDCYLGCSIRGLLEDRKR